MSYRNNLPMACWAEDDKPATKLLMKGKTAISDAELLSLILAVGRNGQSTLDAARLVLNQCNDNLGEIAKLSASDLVRSAGISRASAIRIIASFELGRRRSASEVTAAEKITSSQNAFNILKSCIQDKPYEEFWILLLNRANKLIGKKQISEGGISGTVVDPKKVFKIALDHHASSIILGHNHPSGTTQPSEADCRITQKLYKAGLMLEIIVLDHIILGDNCFYSFADNDNLNTENDNKH